MKAFGLLIVALIVSSPTLAQINHGTVGVIYFTKDKIIIAADSRSIAIGNAPPSDSVCKIAAPHGKIVFVSAQGFSYDNAGLGDRSFLDEH